MAILEKIIRVFLFPVELKMRAQVVESNRDIDEIQNRAEKIVADFKKEISNDPEIKNFFSDYDKKYNSGPNRIL